jgi:hypothetical protein
MSMALRCAASHWAHRSASADDPCKCPHTRQAMKATGPGADQQWARIDHELADQAPLVPLVNRTWIDFVSKRVGNYQFSWQAGPLLDQFWVRS